MMSSTTYQKVACWFYQKVWCRCHCFSVGVFFVVFSSFHLCPTCLNTNSLPHCVTPPFTTAVLYNVISSFTVFLCQVTAVSYNWSWYPSVLYLSATAGLESIKNLARESKNYIASIWNISPIFSPSFPWCVLDWEEERIWSNRYIILSFLRPHETKYILMLPNDSEDQFISWSVKAGSKKENHSKEALSAWKLVFFSPQPY